MQWPSPRSGQPGVSGRPERAVWPAQSRRERPAGQPLGPAQHVALDGHRQLYLCSLTCEPSLARAASAPVQPAAADPSKTSAGRRGGEVQRSSAHGGARALLLTRRSLRPAAHKDAKTRLPAPLAHNMARRRGAASEPLFLAALSASAGDRTLSRVPGAAAVPPTAQFPSRRGEGRPSSPPTRQRDGLCSWQGGAAPAPLVAPAAAPAADTPASSGGAPSAALRWRRFRFTVTITAVARPFGPSIHRPAEETAARSPPATCLG